MKTAWMASLLALLALVALPVSARDITEPEVLALVARMQQAAQRRDVDAVGRDLHDAVEISGSLTAGGQRQDFRYSKQEYLQDLRTAWAQVIDYRNERRNQRIRIADGRATVTADVRDTMVVQGGTIEVQGKETLTLERAGGVLVVTQVVSHGTM